MLNWEMECKKWCPAFKLMTYYGSAKDRKLKRQGWSKPNAFHICITSYTIVLQVRLLQSASVIQQCFRPTKSTQSAVWPSLAQGHQSQEDPVSN